MLLRLLASLLLSFLPAQEVIKRFPLPNGPTLVQHPHNFTCTSSSGTTLSCAVTVTATTAGNLLVASTCTFSNTATGGNPSISSISGDSTWTHGGTSYAKVNYGGTSWESCDMGYVLSAAGGATTITVLWQYGNTGSRGVDVVVYEWHRSSGSWTFDVSNTATLTSSPGCTSCTGPSVTLTGTDVLMQNIGHEFTCSAISSPYASTFEGEDANVEGYFAYASSISSDSAQTWTCTPAGGAAMSKIAFK